MAAASQRRRSTGCGAARRGANSRWRYVAAARPSVVQTRIHMSSHVVVQGMSCSVRERTSCMLTRAHRRHKAFCVQRARASMLMYARVRALVVKEALWATQLFPTALRLK